MPRCNRRRGEPVIVHGEPEKEDKFMKNFETFVGRPRARRVDLLSKLLHLVSHPALAGYTPHGPASLATGQSAAARRGRCPARVDGNATEPHQTVCECFA